MPPRSLREPYNRLLRSVGYLGVGAGAAAAYHPVVARPSALGVVAAPSREPVVGARSGEGVYLGRAQQVLYCQEGVRALSGSSVGDHRGANRRKGSRVGGGVGPCATVQGIVAYPALERIVASGTP